MAEHHKAARFSDDDYMTVREFSRLSGEGHHAVWKAATANRIEWQPLSARYAGGVRIYHREQARQILRELGIPWPA